MKTSKQEHKMKQGDIYWINCDPSYGHEFQGKRPGVIIQSSDSIPDSSLVTVMLMTSNINRQREHDILITRSKKNRLAMDSLIKVLDIHSFDKRRLLKKIGTLETDFLQQLKAYLPKHFDLK